MFLKKGPIFFYRFKFFRKNSKEVNCDQMKKYFETKGVKNILKSLEILGRDFKDYKISLSPDFDFKLPFYQYDFDGIRYQDLPAFVEFSDKNLIKRIHDKLDEVLEIPNKSITNQDMVMKFEKDLIQKYENWRKS
jgi:hypothetical protein